MNEHTDHHDFDPSTLSEGARLRAQADGEISGGDDPRVSFESELRGAVGRVMGADRAPEALRSSVSSILRDLQNQDGDVVSTPLGDTRSRNFWSGAMGWAAIAAVAALATSLLIMSGRSVPSQPGLRGGVLTQAANFVVGEHELCDVYSERFEKKFNARSESEATRSAIEILNMVPGVMSLPIDGLHEAGYEFAGLGRCGVPGRGASAHLVYENTNMPGVTLSLFVQVDTGDVDLLEGTSYVHCAKAGSTGCIVSAPLPEPGEDARKLVVWREGGYIYYLFAPSDGCCEKAKADFHAPEQEQALFEA
jgi:hypothetical protein